MLCRTKLLERFRPLKSDFSDIAFLTNEESLIMSKVVDEHIEVLTK
jgi:hypothetical protein